MTFSYCASGLFPHNMLMFASWRHARALNDAHISVRLLSCTASALLCLHIYFHCSWSAHAQKLYSICVYHLRMSLFLCSSDMPVVIWTNLPCFLGVQSRPYSKVSGHSSNEACLSAYWQPLHFLGHGLLLGTHSSSGQEVRLYEGQHGPYVVMQGDGTRITKSYPVDDLNAILNGEMDFSAGLKTAESLFQAPTVSRHNTPHLVSPPSNCT